MKPTVSIERQVAEATKPATKLARKGKVEAAATSPLTVRIPPALHKRLKLYSVAEGEMIQDLVVEALEDLLARRKA